MSVSKRRVARLLRHPLFPVGLVISVAVAGRVIGTATTHVVTLGMGVVLAIALCAAPIHELRSGAWPEDDQGRVFQVARWLTLAACTTCILAGWEPLIMITGLALVFVVLAGDLHNRPK